MDLYQYRIEKSNETFNEAKTLFDKSFLTGTINRLYYSIFYAASAALLKKDIKTGELSESIGELDNYLFEARQAGDYGDFEAASQKDTERLLNDTQRVVRLILNFIPTIE